MIPKDIIIKHKDFATAIATLGHIPQRDNVNLKELIDAWQTELKSIKSKVVYSECGSCGGGWLAQIKDFYVYSKKKEWI